MFWFLASAELQASFFDYVYMPFFVEIGCISWFTHEKSSRIENGVFLLVVCVI